MAIGAAVWASARFPRDKASERREQFGRTATPSPSARSGPVRSSCRRPREPRTERDETVQQDLSNVGVVIKPPECAVDKC
jgi:hypothetical protein